MAPTADSRSHISEARKKSDRRASTLQRQLAAMVLGRVIERNGGRDLAAGSLEEDLFDLIDGEEEYVDPELRNPDEETLPEMAEINWNIYECN